METTKEKSTSKKKRKTSTKKKTQEPQIDLYQSIREVIKNKKPLTPNQVKQFLSGVITGEIVDSLTKRGAMMNDKITASKLLLEEYRRDEIARKEQLENEARVNNSNSSNEITKELLLELNTRKVEGLEETPEEQIQVEEQQEVVEETQDDLQQ